MIYNQKIQAGVSACVYGCKVRYNGKGWDLIERMGREREMFTFHVYCPEIMAGLGVPRSPIRIAGGNGEAFWADHADIVQQGRGKKNFEMKESVQYVVNAIKRDRIRVYFYMEGSPTCGVMRTSNKGRKIGKPPGILGQKLLDEGLFLIPAQDLQSPIKWWDWRRRMLAFLWLDEQKIESKNELYKIWHVVKFICQEIDENNARKLGKEISDLGSNVDFESYHLRMLAILRKPSSVEKIRQWLWKNYSFYRKKYGVVVPEILQPTTLRGSTHLAYEMLRMEVELNREGYSFSSSPVIYRRDGR
jgi:uncharacterized protein YbbK (DUF523 family)